jgi:methylmalonyl-CoA/ethylmalonyl-CoA epimerase
MAEAGAGVGITGLGQVAISVKDVERATAFYRDVVGLPLLFTAPPGLAFLQCGGVRVMLARPEKDDQTQGASVLYFSVPDIQASYQRMKQLGARFEDEPHMIAKMPTHDLWMVFFRDTEDNLMGMMSEVATA